MSNRATIQQETTIIHKTGQKSNRVAVFDDYEQGSISLDDYCDTFYENDFELLKFVIERIKEGNGIDSVQGVIDGVYENKKGISIEGTWYEWEQIKPIYDKFWE